MNASTRIQIEFGEPDAPMEIPVRRASASASRLPGIAALDLDADHGNSGLDADFNNRSFDADQFIARIRQVLQKEGTP